MSIVSSFSHKQKNRRKVLRRELYAEGFRCKGLRTCRLTYSICSGSGTPARKHDHPYTPYQTPPTITCIAISPLSKTATYPASISIGRIYERPGANIADKDHTVKVPQPQ